MPSFPELSAAAKRVIVVDDDAAVRTMLVRVLVESGFCALPAVSGQHALQIVGAIDVNVAIIDLGLPGEDGWSTLASMRRCNPTLQAIIITAWPHQHDAARAAGANACFEKPLDFGQLLTAVGDAVSAAPGTNGNAPGAHGDAHSTSPHSSLS
jgi:DNA-binding response OmpR family regulator